MEITFTNLLVVVAGALHLDVVTPADAAALIAAGLLSVVLFPAASLALLRRQIAVRPPSTVQSAPVT